MTIEERVALQEKDIKQAFAELDAEGFFEKFKKRIGVGQPANTQSSHNRDSESQMKGLVSEEVANSEVEYGIDTDPEIVGQVWYDFLMKAEERKKKQREQQQQKEQPIENTRHSKTNDFSKDLTKQAASKPQAGQPE